RSRGISAGEITREIPPLRSQARCGWDDRGECRARATGPEPGDWAQMTVLPSVNHRGTSTGARFRRHGMPTPPPTTVLNGALAALQVSVIARSAKKAPGPWRCREAVTLGALTRSVKFPGVPLGPPAVVEAPPGAPGAAPGTSTLALRADPKSMNASSGSSAV